MNNLSVEQARQLKDIESQQELKRLQLEANEIFRSIYAEVWDAFPLTDREVMIIREVGEEREIYLLWTQLHLSALVSQIGMKVAQEIQNHERFHEWLEKMMEFLCFTFESDNMVFDGVDKFVLDVVFDLLEKDLYEKALKYSTDSNSFNNSENMFTLLNDPEVLVLQPWNPSSPLYVGPQ